MAGAARLRYEESARRVLGHQRLVYYGRDVVREIAG